MTDRNKSVHDAVPDRTMASNHDLPPTPYWNLEMTDDEVEHLDVDDWEGTPTLERKVNGHLLYKTHDGDRVIGRHYYACARAACEYAEYGSPSDDLGQVDCPATRREPFPFE